MFKKNLKVLSSYALGIFVSIFLSLALGAVWDFSRIIFSTVTGIIAVFLVYSDMWKFGKYDKVKNTVLIRHSFTYAAGFAIIAAVLEVAAAVCKLTGASNILWYVLMVGMVWFYPFTGFYTDSMFLVFTPVITVVILLFCAAGYYMGTRNISFLDNFAVWKAKKDEKSRLKHQEQIEKIKEQYRNK